MGESAIQRRRAEEIVADRRRRRTAELRATAALLAAFALSGGSCETNEDNITVLPGSPGWIRVEYVSTTSPTTADRVGLGGKAFVNPNWVCGMDSPGVNVTWKNETTGDTGNADSRLTVLFCIPSHEWSAYAIPLALGSNTVAVTATGGGTATARVTIERIEETS